MKLTGSHDMALVAHISESVDEWRCPVCGRHVRVSFEPYLMDVLVEGNANAIHNGFSGERGFRDEPVNDTPVASTGPGEERTLDLLALQDEINRESWWEENLPENFGEDL